MSPPFRTASDFATLAWRAKYILVVAIIVGAAVGYKKGGSNGSNYAASTNLFVTLKAAGNGNDLQQSNNFSISRIASYVSVVTSDEVLDPVAQRYGLDIDTLRSEVSASAADNTVVLNVRVVDSSSRRAGALANAIGARLKRVLPTLDATDAADRSPIRVITLRAATPGSSTGGTTPRKGALIGGLAGLLLGYALAVLRAVSDRRVRTAVRLREAVPLPILSEVPRTKKLRQPWLGPDERAAPILDATRRIALKIWAGNAGPRAQVVLTTSPRPGAGTTLLAAHLAAAAAEAGLHVVLVDANLRSPAIASRLGIESGPGLQAIVADALPITDVVHEHHDASITVLAAGPPVADPARLLASPAMRSTLAQLRETYDVVVLDGASLSPTADALTLASVVDGVIVVVEPRSHLDEVRQSIRELAALDANVLGVVLNKAGRGRSAGGAGLSDPVVQELGPAERSRLTYDAAS
jgi:succinoglycan biosynthesis transport protein ExoP